LTRHPVEVGEPQTGFLGPVNEPIDALRVGRASCRSRPGGARVRATRRYERRRCNRSEEAGLMGRTTPSVWCTRHLVDFSACCWLDSSLRQCYGRAIFSWAQLSYLL